VSVVARDAGPPRFAATARMFGGSRGLVLGISAAKNGNLDLPVIGRLTQLTPHVLTQGALP